MLQNVSAKRDFLKTLHHWWKDCIQNPEVDITVKLQSYMFNSSQRKKGERKWYDVCWSWLEKKQIKNDILNTTSVFNLCMVKWN